MESSKDTFMRTREEASGQEDNIFARKLREMTDPALAQSNTGLTITPQSFLTIDKEGLREKAMAVVDNYLDGHKSPAEGLVMAKKMIDMGEMIKENLADPAANELKIAKGDKYDLQGNTITEQMVGVRWSYKDCGDPIWNELNEKIKEREKFLQSIKGSKEDFIPETGEVVRILEPTKSGKLSLVIKY